MKLATLFAPFLLAGCLGAVPAVAPVADCTEAVVVDALAGMTVAQIENKEGARCSLDAAKIAEILLESQNPAVQKTGAYREAGAYRAAHPGAFRSRASAHCHGS